MRNHDTPTAADPLYPDEGMFDRYLAGECSEVERQVLHGWLQNHPDVATRLNVVSYVAAYPVADMRRMGARAAFELFQRTRMAETQMDGRRPKSLTLRDGLVGGMMSRRWSWILGRAGAQPLRWSAFKARTVHRTWWSVATAFILGIVVAMLGWTSMRHIGHTATRSSITYTTGNGERSTVTLPDGGTVALNVASRLEVPTDYLGGNHTVRLVGEGLFTVIHHAGIPLTVSVGRETVRVLGTSFLVRAYATDSSVTVAVRDGKVSVRSVVLTGKTQMVIGRLGPGGVHVTDPAQFSFATGVLTLDDVSLPAAIAELDRWYDVDIRLGNPQLATLHIAGEFGPGSVAELAETLKDAYQIQVVRHGRVLTLYPR